MGKLKQIVPIAAAVLLMGAICLFSQMDRRELESRLPGSTGKERIEVLTELAINYSFTNPKKAAAFAQEARELMQKVPHREYEARLLNAFSATHLFQGEFDKAENYALRSIQTAQLSGNKKDHADALYFIALINQRRGMYPRVLEPLSRSLELFKEIGHSRGTAKAYNVMGMFYWKINEPSKALGYYLKAGKIYEEIGYKQGTAIIYTNSGIIHMDMGSHDKALVHYRKALETHRELGNKMGIVTALNNIAVVYEKQKKYEEARRMFEETLRLKKEQDSMADIALALGNLGSVHENMEQYPEALAYYTRALETSEAVKNRESIATYLIHIGRLKRMAGKHGDARRNIDRAIVIASEINAKGQLLNAYQELSEILEAQKDFPAALANYKKYKELNESLFSDENSRKIAEMQTRFDVEAKENRITLLEKNEEIQQLNLKKQRALTNSFIIISFLVVVLAAVIYARYRLKRRANDELQREIIGHRQTSQQLRESEEKFRALAEKSVAGIYIIQDKVFKYVNPRYLEIFGYSEDEIVGHSNFKTVYEKDQSLVEQNIRKRLSGEMDSIHYQFRGITKEGEIKHLEIYGTRVLYLGAPAVMGTLIDVSDRKKAEEELLKSRQMESIGILAGGIAHDFNNLLAVISGNLEMAIEEIKQDRHLKKMLTSASTSTYQAADLAEKLVTFSGGGWITPQKVTLTYMLKNTMEYYPQVKPLLREALTHIPAGLNPLYADEHHLRQVFYNILKNAGEAMTTPEPVTIEAKNITFDTNAAEQLSLEPGDYVHVSVTDSGKGIPGDAMPHIFDPYFSTKENVTQKGLGMGLAISYSIIKKHNGHITVDSTVGKGTTVNLYLPVWKSTQQ